MSRHTKEYLEEKYEDVDPWEYQLYDISRKEHILQACYAHMPKREPYGYALDIGCGEGWITKDLPAFVVHGIEISDNAASRLPDTVERVLEPQAEYDLIVATGVLYDHYNLEQIVDWIERSAIGIVVTCHIMKYERPLDLDRLIYEDTFDYRAGTQILRVYDYSE